MTGAIVTGALRVPIIASEGGPWKPCDSLVQEATLAPSWKRVKAIAKEFSKTYFEIITIKSLTGSQKEQKDSYVHFTIVLSGHILYDTLLRQGHWFWFQQVLCHLSCGTMSRHTGSMHVHASSGPVSLFF